MDGLRRWAVRYFLFEGWTWDEPSVAARRRASWPRWRWAVRPAGAIAWWTGAAVGLAYEWTNSHAQLPVMVIEGVLAAFAIGCVIFGLVDGVRHRRAHKHLSPT